ncbi:peptidoglycan/LPS O-acetylase OafA/YrhL [Bradyrhizobium japonicum]|jgi:peptidoglycan/LPS O-acetylase OafA/YrhL|uniref:acyltransferase family protein n=1 Tax=Bradyrhizobium TaxID=374 RepID=UPI000408B7D0|nr:MULTISPECIES: acyltransferase family protein [Bradyrhizobium]MBR0941774.1 acyltransferase family protein [Bradyrhizobium liaoningense]MBR1002931.1 acyltransferase family protein [Bradyrhizobium liaoningense]MBR1030401.1 acyltransferase family protein [Bradyrhizobium liaoningense]MBR1067273.1 acyltransferase family protein [Bradyrhizobium liaoningense]MCP1745219.1 peptidoglycan/LPS O-acetylase OafA/YrhL [Bradyrhizobium japonicum]
MSALTTAAPASERLHALDALRGGALLLGIVLHAAMSFVPATPRFWFIQDTHPSLLLGLLTFTIHVFRMTTFFLMAGFFARMSFHRRGTQGFVRDRLQRIGLPLVIGWPILFTPMSLIAIWASHFPNGGWSRSWPPVLPNFPLAHLWFIYVLLELYVAMLLLRGAFVWLDASGTWRVVIDRVFAGIMRSPLAPLALAIPIGIAFCLDQRWINVMGVRTPDQSLITNAQAWIGFGSAFAVGWLLHRQVDLLRLIERRWLPHLLLAVVLILISFVLAGVMLSAPGTPKLSVSFATLRLVSAILYAPAIWISTFAVLGLALRFMSGFSPTRRYLADASYWLYLIHMPIVMVLQVALSQLDWPGLVKFAIILVVAIPPMLASYHLMVRFTFIGAVLNGRRARREAAPAAAVTGPAVP